MVDVSDLRFTVELDKAALMEGVAYIREDVLHAGHSCPECEHTVEIDVETQPSETDEDRRMVVLASACKSGECEWEHRLMAGTGMTVSGPHPEGKTPEDAETGGFEWGSGR